MMAKTRAKKSVKSEKVSRRRNIKSEEKVIKIYEAPSIELNPVSSNKCFEYFTAIGLSETEAERLKKVLPILPLDGELVALSHKFIDMHQSGWNHDEWVKFITELNSKGYNIESDAARSFWAHKMVGTLLETLRDSKRSVLEKVA